MKKSNLILAACALLLGACSTPKDNPENTDSNKLVFEVSAVNALDTRANLYSQEAIHSIENVNVYVFKDNGFGDYLYLKTFTIAPWVKGTNFERYAVDNAEMVPQGNYKFLGIGRDASDSFTLPTLTAGTTNYNDMIASVSTAGMENEIFAGSKTATVSSQGMRIPIIISRQVAGVLGYFKNVPADIGGTTVKYLRITASDANKAVNLTTGVGATPVGASYNIFNLDLTGQTVNADGAYVGNDLLAQGVVKAVNSQLNGAFMIPVNGITFTVGLYDENNAPLKTWAVMDGLNSSISVLPNHFYAFGTKIATNTTTGTPENPTPDAPIDLMKDQAITVTITPTWSQIHNLTIQ